MWCIAYNDLPHSECGCRDPEFVRTQFIEHRVDELVEQGLDEAAALIMAKREWEGE